MAFHVDLEFASRTDTGLIRSHNEDAVAISTQCGFAILADGMGGYNAGEVASGIATSVLKEVLEERLLNKAWDIRFSRNRRLHQIITEAITHTNTSIIEAARIEPNYSGMGTTVALALFHFDKVTVAHIGDSRVYRLRQNGIVQLTRDHSLLQEQIDAGILTEQEAQTSRHRNLITRAMGVDQEVDIELHDYVTDAEDLYLLCSDGLSDMLTDGEICDMLTNNAHSLNAACDALIESANSKGGRDNISVILLKIKSRGPSMPKLTQRIHNWLKDNLNF